MNNFKKIGLSALAGSLAMFSANAVEYAVSGDAQVVYSTAQGNESGADASNGKGFGVDTDIYFNASGELDNGFTVSVFTALDLEQSNTATSGGINSSAQMTIGMGSLGTVQFNDVFGSAATSIDDVLPKAYEEVWDGTSHGAQSHSFGVSTQSGSVDYRTPAFSLGMGTTVSAAYTYDPNAGTGPASAGGVGGNSRSGEAYVIKIAHDSGLTIGGGIEEVSAANSEAGVGAKKLNRATGYALFSTGPISVGYQETYVDAGENFASTTTAVNEGADTEADGYAIAYTAGNMSFSYAVVNEQLKQNADTTAEVETEMSAIQATYTMGAMTLGASLYETDNPEGVTSTKYEETELSVSFAF
jgi:outer membrane protein OmpU